MLNEIVMKLDQLAELQAQAAALRLDYDAKRADILSAVQSQLDDLDREVKPQMAAAESKAAQLEGEIKTLVIGQGESVKGARLHAVYSAGRVTWDGRGLDGYIAAHSEVAQFRKEGQPSVTIRAAK